MAKRIVHQSSCLHFENIAEHIHETSEYDRIIIHDTDTNKNKVVFVGEKWDKKNFQKKKFKL